MTTAKEQIDALSTAVTNTDKSRRVGWARAYSAEQSAEDLARDVNMLRAERDIMRRAWSFTFGFIEVYDPQAHTALGTHAKEIGALLDPGPAEAGRIRGRQQLEVDEERSLRRSVAAEQSKALRRESQRLWKGARQQERRKLLEKYGFPNEAAFLNYLEQYAAANTDAADRGDG